MIKILAVDDEKDILEYISKIISKRFVCDTDTAASGEEALDKLKKDKFDLVILDIKMPGLSGIDFRSLPIVTQAMSNLSLNVSRIPLSSLESINLDQELEEIYRLVRAGITPSAERIKEYVQVSCLKGNFDLQKVVSCIADILRLEEVRCCSSDATLKDILIVLESVRSTPELKAVFAGNYS